MKYRDKVKTLSELSDTIREEKGKGRRIVHCHGCFDILHPGHLRYLSFARELGDLLVVTATSDAHVGKGTDRPYVPEELRVESLAALEMVDYVAVSPHPTALEAIETISPDIYVKGREYEDSSDPRFLREKELVESRGGRVIFSSGDVVYSSTHLIRAFENRLKTDDARWANLCARHGITRQKLTDVFRKMKGLKFAVMGDVIVDEYYHCDLLGVASESPVLNLATLNSEKFPGGAAIMACHLARLGCEVKLITVLGADENAAWIREQLGKEGVSIHAVEDRERPTVRKTRYLVEDQKVMKVDDYRRHPLDSAVREALLREALPALEDRDAVVFADFGYGVLPDAVIAQACSTARSARAQRSAVVSTSLRGNILRFPEMDIVTPTEREARASLGDFESGISVIALEIYRRARNRHVAITLGARGLVSFNPPEGDGPDVRLHTEYIPALPAVQLDPMGAGDALHSAAAAALRAGAPAVIACLIGDAAAAQQIQQLGNVPLDPAEIENLLLALIPR